MSNATTAPTGLAKEIYEGFALNQTDRWNAVIHDDVVTNSPAGRDIVGRGALQGWVKAFHEAFTLRIDLIDHYVAGDRGLVTNNLHWKHDRAPFFGTDQSERHVCRNVPAWAHQRGRDELHDRRPVA